MLTSLSSNKYETTEADLEVVNKKTAEEIAESLEIMMVETRPLGKARWALRGVVSLLTNQPTNITTADAHIILNALVKRWLEVNMQARVRICMRALEMIG